MKSTSAAPLQRPRREPVRVNWRTWCAGLAALALLPLAASAQTITSAVPGFITYQGKVTNANGTLVGAGTPVNRTVIFRIWGHASNSTIGDLIYSEQQNVTISEGEFSVLVGQGTAVGGNPLGFVEGAKGPPSLTVASPVVFGGATRYLGVTIDDGSPNADPEVSPRQQMVTTAFAFRSKYAESLGANGGSSLTVTDQGNVGIGTTIANYPLSFGTSIGDKIALHGTSGAHYGFGIQPSLLQVHTATSSDDVAFGHGTSTSMTETVRFKGNGNVGIGTAAPSAKLDVNGVINVFDGGSKSQYGGLVSEAGATMINFGINDTRFGSQTSSQQGGFLRVNSQSVSNLFQFYARPGGSTSLSEVFSITSTGNVGIGNGSPSAKLHVNGSLIAGALTASSLTLSGPLSVPGAATTHSQGAWLEWNKISGQGQTFLLNQRGTGSGGIVFGEVDTGNTITERMRISGDGNIGIANTAPATLLHIGTGVNAPPGGLLVNTGWMNTANYAEYRPFEVQVRGTPHLVVNTNGAVGVGTSSPVSTLDVRGGSPVITVGTTTGSHGGIHLGNGGHGLLRSYPSSQNNNNVGLYTTAGDIYLSGNGQATNHLVVKNSGHVGIGTNAPSAPLHVTTTASVSSLLNAYMDGDSATAAPHQAAFTGNYSIIADGRVRSSQAFDVHSDRRIKNVVGLSSGRADLAALMQIEITDFTFKDKVAQSARPQKKVIAQQVESIFPSTVTSVTQVVPDIFESAAFADGWIELATDLKVGEKVRLVAQAHDGLYEVTDVAPGRFRTTLSSAGDKLFVYGREVKDFRVVDYDAIAMLNVSATQEIKREKDAEVAELKAANAQLAVANAELTRRLAEVESKDRARDAKLASIEKLLQSANTVMAQPAKPANANGQE